MAYSTIKATQIRLKHKDKFHMKNFYYMMHEWIVQEGWAGRGDEEFPEIFAGRNDAAGGGSEVWWFWRPKKEINKFFRWEMDINAHVLTLRDIEEVKDGKKFKTNFGDIEVWVKVNLVLDPDDRWKKHPILRHFVDLYVKRMIKNDVEKQKLALKNEAYRFQEAMKSFLGLVTANEETERQGDFFPKGGIGE